jgi:hypothetical protein
MFLTSPNHLTTLQPQNQPIYVDPIIDYFTIVSIGCFIAATFLTAFGLIRISSLYSFCFTRISAGGEIAVFHSQKAECGAHQFN